MTREEIVSGMAKMADFFKARADMAVGDGKMLLLNWMRCAEEAAEVVRAQEPRVMTLEEAASAELVWYDWRTIGVRPAKVNRVPSKTGTYRIQRFGDIDEWNHADEYGEYWRCWTSRPTDAQREATPWN